MQLPRSTRRAGSRKSSLRGGEKCRGAVWRGLWCAGDRLRTGCLVVRLRPCSRLPLRRNEGSCAGRFHGVGRPARQDGRTAANIVSYFYQKRRALREPKVDARAETNKADALADGDGVLRLSP